MLQKVASPAVLTRRNVQSRAVCRLQCPSAAQRLSRYATSPSQFGAPQQQRMPLKTVFHTVEAIRHSVFSSVEDDIVELEIKVDGMMCEGCSSRVIEALQKQPKVQKVSVSLESKIASVEVHAPSQIDAFNLLPGLIKTVSDLGFQAEPFIEYNPGA